MDITDWLRVAPVSAAVFGITLATTLMDFAQGLRFRPQFMLLPYQVVHSKQYYRLFTCTLVHADWMHLLFNMITLYAFGPVTEMILGHWQFLVLYAGSQLVSTIPTLAKHRHNKAYASLGASGAISGLVFSYILFAPTSELLLFLAIPLPAWIFGLLYLAYSHIAARRQFDNVNHDAHIWGAIGGLIFTGMMAPEAFVIFAYQMGLL